MAILRGIPPSSGFPVYQHELDSKDEVNEIEYGYEKWKHCTCLSCINRRIQAGEDRCLGGCDGCRRIRDDVKLPWAIRLARGLKHGLIW